MKDRKELNQEKVDFKTAPGGKEEKESLSLKIQNYVEENSKKVISVSAGIILITVLFFVVKGVMEKNAEESKQQAALKISRILPYYQQGDFKKAFEGDPTRMVRSEKVIGLNEIINKYGGTNQAKYASIYAGQSLLSMDKPAEAIKYFEKALDSPSQLIVEAGNAGLGICNESLGKYKEAAEYYDKAVSVAVSPASKGRYEYYQALCLEKTGDKEKAEKLYREIILENKSDFVGLAKGSLARLGTIIE